MSLNMMTVGTNSFGQKMQDENVTQRRSSKPVERIHEQLDLGQNLSQSSKILLFQQKKLRITSNRSLK
ncbi:hypothetical protein Scep_013462 [Stephania cephalantha]|uniref:Uncharacterized protein n=1 Tax=Stephania cephalantha TaxID=152367 RepID=A0AAP0JH61_9MAGN